MNCHNVASCCSFSLLVPHPSPPVFFFFNDTATTEIYTLSLHDALPIYLTQRVGHAFDLFVVDLLRINHRHAGGGLIQDRKSTRLNSSHSQISYAGFCLKKKKRTTEVATGLDHNPTTIYTDNCRRYARHC